MSPTTSTVARWGLVAAGLVVAVGLGAALMLPRSDTGVGGAVASPHRPATLARRPSSRRRADRCSRWRRRCRAPTRRTETCIQPGTYALGEAVPGAPIDVPAGWWEWDPGSGSVGLLVEHPDAPGGSGWGLVFIQVGDVARDPCDASAGTYPAADVDTPTELATVMASWPGFQATAPETIALDGVEGVRTQLTSTRPAPAPSALGDPGRHPDRRLPGGRRCRHRRRRPVSGRLLDPRASTASWWPSGRWASAGTSPFEREQGIADDPTRHAADLVTQQAIIDSVRFEDSAP